MAGLYRVALDKSIDNIDFFAAGLDLLRDISHTENELFFKDTSRAFYSNTEDGNVTLNQYEKIFVYGCQVVSKSGGKYWFDNYKDSASGLYSAECIDALHEQSLHDSIGWRLVGLIRKAGYSGMLYLIPSPLPNERHPYLSSFDTVESVDVLLNIQSLYDSICKKAGVKYIPLPTTLLAPNGYATSEKFLNETSEENSDYAHLNKLGCEVVYDSVVYPETLG